MNGLILVTDIGSTTTKALLLDTAGGILTPVESCEEPTTVEKPHEDVAVGLFRAVDGLSRLSGVQLRDGGRFLVPFYATSSAGGGLQILVIALASRDTGTVARAVTCGAGGVVLDAFNIDDDTQEWRRFRGWRASPPTWWCWREGTRTGPWPRW